MRRASLALLAALVAGCAALIDINDLEAPTGVAAIDAGAEAGCVAGREPTNLLVTPRGLRTALDATDVYFTYAYPGQGQIRRCAKCGCTEPAIVAAGITAVGGLAVDDTAIYWTDTDTAGSINRADKAGGGNKKTLPADGAIGVAVDERYVYWTVIGSEANNLRNAGVWRANKEDLSSPIKLTSATTLPDNLIPYAIAVDDAAVYYTTAPDVDDTDETNPCKQYDDSGASYGTVRRIDKSTANQRSTVLVSGQPCPLALAASEGALFWANLGTTGAFDGSVWTSAKNGTGARLLAGKQGRPTSVVVREGHVAWSSPASQSVVACTVASGCQDLLPLAIDQANPSGLSADESGVYWVALGTPNQTFLDGALRRAMPGVPR